MAVATPGGISRSLDAITVLADRPVAYYRLGEPVGSTVAVDAARNGHNGSYERNPILGKPGLISDLADTAVDFTNGDVSIPNAPDLTFAPAAPFTIEAWALGVGELPHGLCTIWQGSL